MSKPCRQGASVARMHQIFIGSPQSLQVVLIIFSVLLTDESVSVTHWRSDDIGIVYSVPATNSETDVCRQSADAVGTSRSCFEGNSVDSTFMHMSRMLYVARSTQYAIETSGAQLHSGAKSRGKVRSGTRKPRGAAHDSVMSTVEGSTDSNTHGDPSDASRMQNDGDWEEVPELLSCGTSPDYTMFDHLAGVKDRDTLEQLVEKDVFSNVFPMNSPANIEILRSSELKDLLANNAELHRRLQTKKDTAELLNGVGQLYRVRGNTTAAINCFRAVLAKNPSDNEALLNLCDTLFRLEKWAEAEEVIRYSLTHTDHKLDGQNHFALGRTLLAQGRNIEAVEAFKRCLRLNPNYHTAQAGLAVSRSFAGRHDHNMYTIVVIGCCVVATLFFVQRTLRQEGDDVALPDSSPHYAGEPGATGVAGKGQTGTISAAVAS